jgi:hypothetical protein
MTDARKPKSPARGGPTRRCWFSSVGNAASPSANSSRTAENPSVLNEGVRHVEQLLPADVRDGSFERTRVRQEPTPRAVYKRFWRDLIDRQAIDQLDHSDQATDG